MVSGMTLSMRTRSVRLELPQWSPLVVSGMTTVPHHMPQASRWPQWSPLVVSGMTDIRKLIEASGPRPQWSPLVVSGMTRPDVWVLDVGERAAMEPARGERDDQCGGAG